MKKSTAILLLLPTPALAANEAASLGAGSVFRMLGALCLIIGVLYLFYALAPKWNKLTTRLAARNGRQVKILETTGVAPKSSLCLVEVNGEKMLLGVTPANISFLATVDPESPDSFSEALEKENEDEAS